jgi:hypothetical protein
LSASACTPPPPTTTPHKKQPFPISIHRKKKKKPAQSLAQDTLSTFYNGFAAAILTGLENALNAEMLMGKWMRDVNYKVPQLVEEVYKFTRDSLPLLRWGFWHRILGIGSS